MNFILADLALTRKGICDGPMSMNEPTGSAVKKGGGKCKERMSGRRPAAGRGGDVTLPSHKKALQLITVQGFYYLNQLGITR